MIIADFETLTEAPTRVWLWAFMDLETNGYDFVFGNSIEEFIYNEDLINQTVYFHGLAFDGDFIINYLLKNNFSYCKTSRNMDDNSFNTLIDEMNNWYQIVINFTKKRKIKFIDSAKILPFKLKHLPKAFGVKGSKGEIDYKLYRPENHRATLKELYYMFYDLRIPKDAIKIVKENGASKMTLASSTLNNYKEFIGKKKFDLLFPNVDEYYDFLVKAYKGGYVYVNKRFKNKIVKNIHVYDRVSMYPAIMSYDLLPYGRPIPFNGKYPYNKYYNLFVQKIDVSFRLKEGYLPTIQIKNDARFKSTEYLENSVGEIVTLYVTNYDLEMLLAHYEIDYIEYKGGLMFMSLENMFKDYIEGLIELKTYGKRTNNKGLYTSAKLLMNSLYGKFAAKPKGRNKIPYLKEDGTVGYKISSLEDRNTYYIPVALFITSKARYDTISFAQKFYDNYIYSDTDSCHFTGLTEEEVKKEMTIDDFVLGAWSLETRATHGKYIQPKRYMLREANTKYKVKCAGLSDEAKENVTFQNFKEGSSFKVLKKKRVEGGIILIDTDYTIK